jgi:two-component system chemotaxis response regulator CheY
MQALVIDDSRAMRSILGQILKGLGFSVAEAGHGQEGLDHLRQGLHPDVILLDWNMPVMNGYEFLKTVRAESAYRELTIMMVTTESEMSQVVRALAAGANEYVMKPFTAEVIREKLQLLGVTNDA